MRQVVIKTKLTQAERAKIRRAAPKVGLTFVRFQRVHAHSLSAPQANKAVNRLMQVSGISFAFTLEGFEP